MLVFLAFQVHILADVTSRLLPLPARDWTENLDEPSYVCRSLLLCSHICFARLTKTFWDTAKKHTTSIRVLQEFFRQFTLYSHFFIYSLCVFVTLSMVFV